MVWDAWQVPIQLQYPRLRCTCHVHAAFQAFVAHHGGLCAAVGIAVRRLCPEPLCPKASCVLCAACVAACTSDIMPRGVNFKDESSLLIIHYCDGQHWVCLEASTSGGPMRECCSGAPHASPRSFPAGAPGRPPAAGEGTLEHAKPRGSPRAACQGGGAARCSRAR